MHRINEILIKDIINNLPENKKEQLEKACTRNNILTSFYGLENGYFTVYKEGFLIELFGCRCKFAVYVKDNDGKLIYCRKPKENNLSILYKEFFKASNIINF